MPNLSALFPAIHGVECLAIRAMKGDVMKPKLTESQQVEINALAAMPDKAPPNEQKTIDLI